MKTSLLVLASLLLLLLATRAHGIRLDRQLHEVIDKKEEMRDSKAGQQSSTDTAEAMSKQRCTSDGHCSGKAGKSLTHAESGAARQRQQQQQSFKRNDGGTTTPSSPASRHGHEEAAPPRQPKKTTYPDILDIAGMDYSPATRKPPIHN